MYNVEYRVMHENLYKFKGYSAKNISEFPRKGWNFNYLLRKLRDTDSTATELGNQEVDDVGEHVQMKTLML